MLPARPPFPVSLAALISWAMAGTATLPAEASEASDPGLDATIFHSRVKLTNEYIESDFDVAENTTKLGLAYAFGEVPSSRPSPSAAPTLSTRSTVP